MSSMCDAIIIINITLVTFHLHRHHSSHVHYIFSDFSVYENHILQSEAGPKLEVRAKHEEASKLPVWFIFGRWAEFTAEVEITNESNRACHLPSLCSLCKAIIATPVVIQSHCCQQFLFFLQIRQCCTHTWYLSFFLHRQNFWPKFSPRQSA